VGWDTVAPDAGRRSAVVPVGDPARARLRSALVGVLLASVVFVWFALLTTQAKALRAHSPWQDDPYDAVVSFTIFFVPLVLVYCVVRASVCTRAVPLPIQRARSLLRAMWLTVCLIAVTVGVDWVGVVLGAHRASWTRQTALLVGFLVATSLVAVVAAAYVRVAARQPVWQGRFDPRSSPDLAADVLTLSQDVARRLRLPEPVARRMSIMLRGFIEGTWGLRRHPLLWAGAVSVAFGLVVAAGASQEEGLSPVLGLFVVAGTGAMFAFLVLAGSFLGVVASVRPLTGTRRRIVDALTLASASVPVAIGVRDSLWWLVHASSTSAGLMTVWILLGTVAGSVFVAVIAAETALRLHASPGPTP